MGNTIKTSLLNEPPFSGQTPLYGISNVQNPQSQKPEERLRRLSPTQETKKHDSRYSCIYIPFLTGVGVDHVLDLSLQLLDLLLERAHRLQEELVAVPLSRALDRVDKVVPLAAQLDLALKLLVPQHLSAHRVVHGVVDHGHGLPLVAGILRVLLGRLLGDLFELDDARQEALLKLLGVVAQDGLQDLDDGHEAVAGRGYGRELGVVRADALVHVHLEVNHLPRPQLGDEDVGVRGADHVVARKVLFLLADGLKDDILGVNVRIVVQLPRVRLAGRGVGVVFALDLQPQLYRVVVIGCRIRILSFGRLVPPRHEVSDALLAAGERDQAQAVGQDLILNDTSIVVDKHRLDRKRGDFRDEDTSESIGNRGIDTNQRELCLELVILVEFYP